MKVCVVGTGPSGLTTIKQLLDEKHEVTCFEKSASLGGIWYRNDNDGNEMKVFDNLILTVSMKMMSYSDFLFQGDRKFFSHQEYLAYMEAYAEKFNLRECISFNTTVKEVKKTPEGKWRVTVTSGGKDSTHEFDAVALCVGPFQKPNFEVAGLKNFTGEVVHSYQYRNNQRFKNKRVLVVGLAESGADVLREISDVASECTLGIRTYSYLLPRLNEGVFATDEGTVRSHHFEMWDRSTRVPNPLRGIQGDTVAEKVLFKASTKLFGLATAAKLAIENALKPKYERHHADAKNKLGESMLPKKLDIGTEWNEANVQGIREWNARTHADGDYWVKRVIFCKNASFIPNIVNGKISLNDAGIESMSGSRVTFKDGVTKEFDIIVLCTGFKKDFSVLGGDLSVKDDNVRNLYKHAFHPDHDGRIAIIGLVRPYAGGIPICSEMQARYFAQLCSNKIKLPADVHDRIAKEKAWEEENCYFSPRHTEAIPSQVMFIDSLAKEIGCLMPTSELLKNPRLLVRHWFYPFNQACYRLTGPHSDYESAIKEIFAEKPGYLTRARPVLQFVALSFLPGSIRPKGGRPWGGDMKPPKASSAPPPHDLSRPRRVKPQPSSATNGAHTPTISTQPETVGE